MCVYVPLDFVPRHNLKNENTNGKLFIVFYKVISINRNINLVRISVYIFIYIYIYE